MHYGRGMWGSPPHEPQHDPSLRRHVKYLGEFLRDNADTIAREIMADWDQVGVKEPWHRLPPNIDQDHLPDMIRFLAEAALLTFFAEQPRRTLAWAAVQHGQHRFTFGLSEEILGREYALLRWAMWRRLKQQGDTGAASEAIIRLDSGISFAHGASLRGYHRLAIEGSGDWPDAVDRYLSEWSFPG
jgi:hypothetical protein